jgi:hypothetical protein
MDNLIRERGSIHSSLDVADSFLRLVALELKCHKGGEMKILFPKLN